MRVDAGLCAACGRPFSPAHDASAPGPTVRHTFKAPGQAATAPPTTLVVNPHDAAALEAIAGPLPDAAVTVSHPIRTVVHPPIAVPAELLDDGEPDLLAVIRAEIAGERPHCSCRPIHAWPDGPVVGYHDQCDEHRGSP